MLENKEIARGKRTVESPFGRLIEIHMPLAGKPKGIIFDMDGTLYVNDEYSLHLRDSDMQAIAKKAEWSDEDIPTRIKDLLSVLQSGNRRARLIDLIHHIGFSDQEWTHVREERYNPEKYIKKNSNVQKIFEHILEHNIKVAIASNSPSTVCKRILKQLGVETHVVEEIEVAGSDTIGHYKPDVQFFVQAARMLDISQMSCLSIGDTAKNDVEPALSLGMGAALTESPEDLELIVRTILN